MVMHSHHAKCLQGAKFTPERLQSLKDRAVLKQEVRMTHGNEKLKLKQTQTRLDDCADAFVSAAKVRGHPCIRNR